jgi:hypothetical protein
MDKQTEILNKMLQMFDKQAVPLNKILVSSQMSKIKIFH